MLRVLAIDPATKTGVADTYGLRRLWNLDVLAPHDFKGRRELAIAGALRRQLSEATYDLVAVEEASYGATGQQAVMAFHNRLLGVILLVCAEKRIPVILGKPTEIKKFATGSGAAKKADMVRLAKVAGESVRDDNIADAFWVMQWALNKAKLGEV